MTLIEYYRNKQIRTAHMFTFAATSGSHLESMGPQPPGCAHIYTRARACVCVCV